MIYYEFVRGSINTWNGTLIEIDDMNMLHISNYQFVFEEPKGLKIQAHDHMMFSLFDFLNCVHPIQYIHYVEKDDSYELDEDTYKLVAIYEHQFKGAFFKEEHGYLGRVFHYTYIFIDNYYLVVTYDLVSMMFILFKVDEWSP